MAISTEGVSAPIVAAGDAAAAPASQRRYAIFLLMWVGLFSIMDRQILNILAELIRDDLDLSDAQLGLLTGLAFAIFYAGFSLPLARLAETRHRGRLIAACLALWSAFTALGGLAQSFTQLFLTRLLVGVGEAGSGPASQSLAADLAAPGKRASALATAAVGVPLGTLVGMALGGWVGGAFGWRAALIAAGLPGLAFALLVALTLKDPRPTSGRGAPDHVPFGDALREIAGKRSFIWFTVGSALLSIPNLAIGAFAGSFFLRLHARTLEAAATAIAQLTGADLSATGVLGILLGVVLGLAGAVGMLVGGFAADAARRRDPAAYMTVAALGSGFAGPLFASALLLPSGAAALAVLAVPVALCAGVVAPIMASAQSVVRPRVRATAAATLFLASNLVALGFGPLLAGMLSDGFAARLGAAEGLRWALISACAVCPLAAIAFLAARHRLVGDLVG